MAGETADSPLHMKMVGETSPGKVLAITIMSLAPVAIAIIMQNSALRQALAMKSWHYVRLTAGKFERAASEIKSYAGHRYDIARL